jgi:hypothetical protein
VHAGLDLPNRQPPDGGLVDFSLRVNGVISAVPTPVNDSRMTIPCDHVSHLEPAAAAFQPLRRFERAVREHRAIPDRVRQGHGLGRGVESNRVRARNRAARVDETSIGAE